METCERQKISIGCDGDAEEVTYKFSELSERAKQTARDHHTSGEYLPEDWWDAVYEDAVRMGAMLGIEISTTTHRGKFDKTYQTTDIYFSGFCSQGDGACFAGNYRFAPDAVEEIQQETTDEELLRIAQGLTLLQLTRMLKGFAFFSATLTTSGRYSHSGMMAVNVNSEDEDGEHSQISEDLEDEITQFMRDFADLIYKWLEQEHDWLYSDECVDEALADKTFDEDGHTI